MLTRQAVFNPLSLARHLCAALLAAAIWMCLLAGGARAAVVAVPPQGTWEDCGVLQIPATCAARLHTMRAIGLSFAVIDPMTYNPTAIASCAAAAHADGIGLIWYLANPGWWVGYKPSANNMLAQYAAVARSCGCHTNEQLEHGLIGMLAALPATRGYYVADDGELTLAPQASLAAWAARVRADDPNPAHITMIAHWGMSQSGATGYAQYAGIGNVDANEWYPDRGPLSNALSDLSWESEMASQSHAISEAHGQQTAFFLQSFSWGDSLSDGLSTHVCTSADTAASCAVKLPFPSTGDMITIRNTAILAGAPSMLIWYRWTAVAGYVDGTDPVLARIGATGMKARLDELAAAVPGTGAGSPGPSGRSWHDGQPQPTGRGPEPAIAWHSAADPQDHQDPQARQAAQAKQAQQARQGR